jgi:hypothetical protein
MKAPEGEKRQGPQRSERTAFCRLRGKIAQIARRYAKSISLQSGVLDGLRVVLRDDISNLQPLLFSLVAGNRQYIVQQGS